MKKYIEETVRAELMELAEPKYKQFASSLIPGCNNLIGVRIPLIRNIAKRMAKDNPIEYLEKAEEIYFEETMLKALIIGNMKADIEVILGQATQFIPHITNWSLCDSFCTELKIVKENKERVWRFLEPYWKSNVTYEIRVAVVMGLFYYIDLDYLEQLFGFFNDIQHEDYYVKMAVAWAISMCYVKFPEETMGFLQRNKLDNFTYNKALQKICESLQVDEDTKRSIKLMKRGKK